jgi:hypothetical protein
MLSALARVAAVSARAAPTSTRALYFGVTGQFGCLPQPAHDLGMQAGADHLILEQVS